MKLKNIRLTATRIGAPIAAKGMTMDKTRFMKITGTALALTAVNGFAADGKEVYNKACAVCHNPLTPKISDKAAWEPRVKQGTEALVAAVDYMVTQLK